MEMGVEFQRTLHALRAAGWVVAVHNDYRQDGQARTFWLLTHPNGRWVKGEGVTDMDAIMQCDAAVRAIALAPTGPIDELELVAAVREFRSAFAPPDEEQPAHSTEQWAAIERLEAALAAAGETQRSTEGTKNG